MPRNARTFDEYKDDYPHIKMERSDEGIRLMQLHNGEGGEFEWSFDNHPAPPMPLTLPAGFNSRRLRLQLLRQISQPGVPRLGRERAATDVDHLAGYE